MEFTKATNEETKKAVPSATTKAVVAESAPAVVSQASVKAEPALKRYLEGVKEIDGIPVTFWASSPIRNRKCEWDEKVPEDAWKPLPGYDATYAKHEVRDFYKKARPVFMVRTRDELQLWAIDA